MSAQRNRNFNAPVAQRLAESRAGQAESAPAAQGGVIADWHRHIEQRFAVVAGPAIETPGEILSRQVSRAVGLGALFAGYAGVIYLIFG